jgi:hypothetical protein
MAEPDIWSGSSYETSVHPSEVQPTPDAAPVMPPADPWHSGGYATSVPGNDPITGRPFQYASSIPDAPRADATPVGQSMGRVIRTDQVPGIVTQAISSLPTDPEQRRRVIAGQLFPEMKPEEAQSRIFYGVNGRLAAVAPDGHPYYVEPEALNPSVPSTFAPSNLIPAIGGMAGPALPAAGGVAGGMVAGPGSLVVGPVLAAGGAAAGDVARQEAARYFDPQPEKSSYNVPQTALAAAGAGAGQLAGAALVSGFSPNRLGAAALDVNRVRAGGVLPEAERVNQLAQQQGVRLTPGQASGLPSLLSHEDVVASGSAGPGLSDIASTYYRGQRAELEAAYQRTLGGVSSASDKTDAAMQFSQGLDDATRIVRQQANAAARPSYQAAEQAGQVMSPDLAQLADVPAVKTALNAARADYANLYRRPAPETPDFNLWNLAKQKLDDSVSIARRAGDNTTAMANDSLRGDLLTHLDAAYPTYSAARAASAPGQRLAGRLQDMAGGGGDLGTERARAIVAPAFEGNNPRQIAEAKDAFTQAGRSEEWNAGTRAYLQDAFDRASKSQEGLNPSMLRRQVWSDPDRRAAMQAAMDPQAFNGLDNFMQVLEAAARSRGMNSLTAPRQAGAKALEEAAAGTPGVKAVNLIGAATSPSTVMSGGRSLTDPLAGWMTKRNLAGIGERLFSPDGMEYLRQMGGMSPISQRALTTTAQFLGEQGGRYVAPTRLNPLAP